MARTVKVLVFHAQEDEKCEAKRVADEKYFEVKDVEDIPFAFAGAIGSQYINIMKRKIGNKLYNIIFDDDGFYTDNPIATLLDKQNQNKNVFGTVAIAGIEDNYGELTDLSDDDISTITSRIGYTTRIIQGKAMVFPVIMLG